MNPEASQTPEATGALESEEPELEIQEVQPLFFTPQFVSLRDGNSMVDFNEKWDNAQSCDNENVPGCVIGPKQSVGRFDNPGDVELRKLVTKTDNPGEYQIKLAVRGKEITTTGSTENDVCAAVVFDKSGSMKDKA